MRETMAVVSAATAVEPPAAAARPGARRGRRRSGAPTAAAASTRWRTAVLAAAAALVDRASARSGSGSRCGRADAVDRRAGLRRARRADRVGRHPDRRHRDVVFSRERNAGVLVMNNVAAARSGHGVPDVAGRRQRRRTRRARWTPRPSRRRPPRCCPTSATPRAGVHRRAGQRFDAADRRRCSPNCRWSDDRYRSVAVAASAMTSATSPRRRHARRCRIAPLPSLGDAVQFVAHQS